MIPQQDNEPGREISEIELWVSATWRRGHQDLFVPPFYEHADYSSCSCVKDRIRHMKSS